LNPLSNRPFIDVLKQTIGASKNKPFPSETFCTLPYQEEWRLKNRAVQQWWHENRLPGHAEQIVPSPKPRHYRNTSKRRVVFKHDQVRFVTVDDNPGSALLEAESHGVLYDFFQEEMNRHVNQVLARSMNYIIIRGSYDRPSVIMNVNQFNAPVIRRCKMISQKIKELPLNVMSVFIYLDPRRSNYYLEARQPDKLSFKKLFGPDKLFLKTENLVYSYDPTCFSQVNESMVPRLLICARDLLSPLKGHRLLDLYCGYGLFSFYMAFECAQVIGIEKSRTAIRSATENKRHINPNARMNFIAQDIKEDAINKKWSESESIPEVILLDPPFQGTSEGVIQALCKRNPDRILHIFCSMDALLREIDFYLKNKYELCRVVPLDLFPGTPNLEMLLLFNRAELKNTNTRKKTYDKY
jgi:tRNA/tmRNA/rRNA uracil-C5-methylase (TrmA/RlmC/RlmD family)